MRKKAIGYAWFGLAALALTAGGCVGQISPGKAQPGEVGSSCGADEECTAQTEMTCLKMQGGGYCSLDCSLLGDYACPAGAICEQLGDQAMYCMDGCCSQDDCRQDYRCARRPEIDIYQDLTLCPAPGVCLLRCSSDAGCQVGERCDLASGECVPTVGVNAGVGAGCANGTDCNSGSCLTAFPGGYCTSACGTQFDECEAGSSCYELPGAGSTCMKVCQNDAECRSGYRCQQVGADAQSGAVRGFCVPRCQAHSDCPEGQHCESASGECVDGPAEAGPIGAFCSAAADCQSGDCQSGWPNGYCIADCSGCGAAGEVCVDGQCLAACTTAADCRYQYTCIDGGCQPSCTSDSDCAGGLTCNTGSGLCVQPVLEGSVVTFEDATLDISSSGSQELTFTVPPDAVSAVIHVSGLNDIGVIHRLYGPGGELLFDIGNYAFYEFLFLPTAGTFTGLIPPGPVFNFIPGDYRVSFVQDSGSSSARVQVFGKVAAGFPSSQQLDVVFTFVGDPVGLSAAAAQTDSDFQQAVTEYRSIYDKLGITVGDITYQDLGGSLANQLRVIDSTEGPSSELSQLFATSTDQGQGMNFFFVEEIVDADEGFTILGIAGGIPGPPGLSGGPHSGVAVTMLKLRSDPTDVGQTIAHEGGHYLGLFHTSEAGGTSHDPLPDTPECTSWEDSDWDGYVSDSECNGKGAENFMFWLSTPTARGTSAEQGRVLRRNPATE